MSGRTRLRVVRAPDAPAIDIHALIRADIKDRDWSGVHLAGDRNAPVALGPRVATEGRGRWYSTRREA